MREMNVIVVGDSVIDRYYEGSVTRISPEAPCPIVDINSFIEVPGGAANVAMNLSGLDIHCSLVTVLGGDEHDEGAEGIRVWFLDEPRVKLWAYHHKGFSTPIKNRVCADNGQQLVRFDMQNNRPFVDAGVNSAIWNKVESLLYAAEKNGKPSILVLSDYGKGVLRDRSLVQSMLELAHILKIPSVVDPKDEDLTKYSPACLLKPNLREAQDASDGIEPEECAKWILREMNPAVQGVLVTCGIDGMALATCEGGDISVRLIPAYPPRSFCNPCGAGDTVTALLATQLACTAENYEYVRYGFSRAAKCASIGAGVVVARPGTAVLHSWEFDAALAEHCVTQTCKSGDLDITSAVVEQARNNNEEIVLTNGCFDQLHPGHLHLLQEARRMGDVLVVAINSDESVRRIKGPDRPLVPCEQRIKMLEALQCVDVVVVFDEDTPERLIKTLKPNLLVKGSEYLTDDMSKIPGAESVLSNHGGVLFVKMLEGFSTTANKATTEAINKLMSDRHET